MKGRGQRRRNRKIGEVGVLFEDRDLMVLDKPAGLLSQIAEIEKALDEPRRVLAQVGVARLRKVLDPLREPHGVPLGRAVHAQVIPNLADHHIPGIETETCREVQAPLQAKLVRVLPIEDRITNATEHIAQIAGKSGHSRDNPVALLTRFSISSPQSLSAA